MADNQPNDPLAGYKQSLQQNIIQDKVRTNTQSMSPGFAQTLPNTAQWAALSPSQQASAIGMGFQFIQEFYGADAANQLQIYALPPAQRAAAFAKFQAEQNFAKGTVNAAQNATTVGPNILKHFSTILANAAKDPASILGADTVAGLDKIISMSGYGNQSYHPTGVSGFFGAMLQHLQQVNNHLTLPADWVRIHPGQAAAIMQYVQTKAPGMPVMVQEGGVINALKSDFGEAMNAIVQPLDLVGAAAGAGLNFAYNKLRTGIGNPLAHMLGYTNQEIDQGEANSGLGHTYSPDEFVQQVLQTNIPGGGFGGWWTGAFGMAANDPRAAWVEMASGAVAAELGADPLILKGKIASAAKSAAGLPLGADELAALQADPEAMQAFAEANKMKSWIQQKAFVANLRSVDDVLATPYWQRVQSLIADNLPKNAAEAVGEVTQRLQKLKLPYTDNLVQDIISHSNDPQQLTAVFKTYLQGARYSAEDVGKAHGVLNAFNDWKTKLAKSIDGDRFAGDPANLSLDRTKYDLSYDEGSGAGFEITAKGKSVPTKALGSLVDKTSHIDLYPMDSESNNYFVNFISVPKELQRQGIARGLWEAAAKEVQRVGGTMFSGTSLTDESRAFWEDAVAKGHAVRVGDTGAAHEFMYIRDMSLSSEEEALAELRGQQLDQFDQMNHQALAAQDVIDNANKPLIMRYPDMKQVIRLGREIRPQGPVGDVMKFLTHFRIDLPGSMGQMSAALDRVGQRYPHGLLFNPEFASEAEKASTINTVINTMKYMRMPRDVISKVIGEYNTLTDSEQFFAWDARWRNLIADNSPILDGMSRDAWRKIYQDASSAPNWRGVIHETGPDGIVTERPVGFYTAPTADGTAEAAYPMAIEPGEWARSSYAPNGELVRNSVSTYRKVIRRLPYWAHEGGTRSAQEGMTAGHLAAASSLRGFTYLHNTMDSMWAAAMIAPRNAFKMLFARVFGEGTAYLYAAGRSNYATSEDYLQLVRDTVDPRTELNLENASRIGAEVDPQEALGTMKNQVIDAVDKQAANTKALVPLGHEMYGQGISDRFNVLRAMPKAVNDMLVEGESPAKIERMLMDQGPGSFLYDKVLVPIQRRAAAMDVSVPELLGRMQQERMEIIGGDPAMAEALKTGVYIDPEEYQSVYDKIVERLHESNARDFGGDEPTLTDEEITKMATEQATRRVGVHVGTREFADLMQTRGEDALLQLKDQMPGEEFQGPWQPPASVSAPSTIVGRSGRFSLFDWLDTHLKGKLSFQHQLIEPEMDWLRNPTWRDFRSQELARLKLVGLDTEGPVARRLAADYAAEQTRAMFRDFSDGTAADRFMRQFAWFFPAWKNIAERWLVRLPEMRGGMVVGHVSTARFAQDTVNLMHGLGFLQQREDGSYYVTVPGVEQLLQHFTGYRLEISPASLTLLSALPGLNPSILIPLALAGKASPAVHDWVNHVAAITGQYSPDSFQLAPQFANSLWESVVRTTPPWEVTSRSTQQYRMTVAMDDSIAMAADKLSSSRPNPDKYKQGEADPQYRKDYAAWVDTVIHHGLNMFSGVSLIHGLSTAISPFSLNLTPEYADKAAALWKALSVFPNGDPVRSAALEQFNQQYPGANFFLSGHTITNGGVQPDTGGYDQYLKSLTDGTRTLLTPQQFAVWSSGMAELSHMAQRRQDVVDKLGGNLQGVLNNYFQYRGAVQDMNREWTRFLTTNKEFANLWNTHQDDVPASAGAKWFQTQDLLKVREDMANVADLFTDHGIVSGDYTKFKGLVSDQLDKLAQASQGTPGSQLSTDLKYYWDNVATPYYDKLNTLYNKLDTTPSALRGPIYAEIRKINDAQQPAKYHGMTLPTPEAVSFNGLSPEAAKEHIAHWGLLSVSYLDNFQLSKTYTNAPKNLGELTSYMSEGETALTDWASQNGVSSSSAAYQQNQQYLMQKFQEKAKELGIDPYWATLDQQPAFARLHLMGYGANNGAMQDVMGKVATVWKTLQAHGLSPRGGTPQAVAMQQQIVQLIADYRDPNSPNYDETFDNLMTRLEQASAPSGGAPLVGADMVMKVFFDSIAPASQAVAGG